MATTPVNDGTVPFMDAKQKKRYFSTLPTVQADASDIQQDDDDWNPRLQTETKEAEAKKMKYTHPNSVHPNSVPSSIKVKTSSGSQVTSSVPGLSSFHDMSMTEMSEEFQISVVKTCVKKYLFHTWKFYQPDFQEKFDESEGTMCGFIMKRTGCKGDPTWWFSMRKIVVATLTLCRNNAIKNMGMKFKGKQNQATFPTSKLL